MSAMQPVAVYGLEVPAGDLPIPAAPDFPATFRITMAAIDPTATPQLEDADASAPVRATLKLIRERIEPGDDDDEDEDDEEDFDDDDIEAIQRRIGAAIGDDDDEDEDEEDDEDDEDVTGGPSDPSKTKKARQDAAIKDLLDSVKTNGDEKMTNGVNGTKKSKGKQPIVNGELEDEDDEDDDEDDDDEFDDSLEEFVICTLDPEKHYQQAIDITVGENEEVYFKVTGTHNIYLTGNYVVPTEDDDEDDDDEDEMYGMGADEDELEEDDYDEEEDELDGLEDPRVEELEDDDEAPKLLKATGLKGKNKRAAEEDEDEDMEDVEEGVDLDELIKKASQPTKSTKAAEEKLSKQDKKKLKTNEGGAVAAPEAKKDSKDTNGKKVQFAKNLEQGPTGSPLSAAKKDDKKETKADDKPKAALGVKTVQGVKIDDKKLGKGPAAKKGDRIGMRYIGKLEKDGKVFDSNKKGEPFKFKLGSGEVIKGWDIGVAGMSMGGERRITIPANLAYGSKAQPGIPANSTLVFDVKMMSIN